MSATIDDLKRLQKRIRECKGADRELDKTIWLAIGNAPRVVPEGCTLNTGLAPRYTTYPDGLGACVSLMDSVLPGCVWERVKGGAFFIYRTARALMPLNWLDLPEHNLPNDCLTFIDAIVAANISELEAALVQEH
jgi:hypothetical protein